MNILDIICETGAPEPWEQGDNIPWNDPEFSERMLREHLSQAHDLASRCVEVIEGQVDWIDTRILCMQSARILDLCCGPGLYGARLAEHGHHYMGVDYSPASIKHARRITAGCDRCHFVESDVRATRFGVDNDLAMIIYGEFNVFCPSDAADILNEMNRALRPGGLLLLEPHTRDAVLAIGNAGSTWEGVETGIFSDRPHLCLQRSHWDEDRQAATRQFYVVDGATCDVSRYAVSYQAYSDAEYRELLVDRGFDEIEFYPSLTGRVVSDTPGLMAIVARKAK